MSSGHCVISWYIFLPLTRVLCFLSSLSKWTGVPPPLHTLLSLNTQLMSQLFKLLGNLWQEMDQTLNTGGKKIGVCKYALNSYNEGVSRVFTVLLTGEVHTGVSCLPLSTSLPPFLLPTLAGFVCLVNIQRLLLQFITGKGCVMSSMASESWRLKVTWVTLLFWLINSVYVYVKSSLAEFYNNVKWITVSYCHLFTVQLALVAVV